MNPSSTATPPSGGTHPLGASLRRATDDRVLLGLCGGIARSTGTSAVAVRLGTLALGVVLLPLVVLAYLVTALILPRDDDTVLLGSGPRERRDSIVAVAATMVAAPIVLGAGAASIVTSGDAIWVTLVIAAILALVIGIVRPGKDAQPTQHSASTGGSWVAPGSPIHTPETFPAASAFGESTDPADAPTFVRPGHAAPDEAPTFVRPAASASGDAPTFVKSAGAIADHPADQVTGGPEGGELGGPAGPGEPPTTDGPFPGPPAGEPAPATPRRRGLALPVLAILALIPSTFAVGVSTGILDSGWNVWAVMLALMAVAAAGGAVAIAVLRPSYLGAGLLVLVAAALGASSVVVHQFGPVLDDGVGERAFRPTSADELRRPFILGAGELTIDLRDLELRPRSRTTVHAKIGFGEVVVIVPRGVRVTAAPGSTLTSITTSARRNGAATDESASAPIIELDVRARGAEVQLLTGGAQLRENLETLAVDSTGFWDGNSSSPSRGVPPFPVSPDPVPAP